jgi:hypothetical protein
MLSCRSARTVNHWQHCRCDTSVNRQTRLPIMKTHSRIDGGLATGASHPPRLQGGNIDSERSRNKDEDSRERHVGDEGSQMATSDARSTGELW